MSDQWIHFDKAHLAADSDVTLIISHATLFASIKHSKQRRKDIDKTPYINHPIGVAHILLSLGQLKPSSSELNEVNWKPKDSERPILALPAVLGAILHDTVEDTDTTLEEIEAIFGKIVASIVQEVTDDKSLGKQERKDMQVKTAPFKSKEAKAVKLADKLYNLRDLSRQVPEGWTKERVQEYFTWAQRVVEGCRGTLPAVEQALDELFRNGMFTIDGAEYKCLGHSNSD